MPYRIAGIDVHKRMLAVVIADVSGEGEYQFERRPVDTNPGALRRLAQWLVAEEVEELRRPFGEVFGGCHEPVRFR